MKNIFTYFLEHFSAKSLLSTCCAVPQVTTGRLSVFEMYRVKPLHQKLFIALMHCWIAKYKIAMRLLSLVSTVCIRRNLAVVYFCKVDIWFSRPMHYVQMHLRFLLPRGFD